MNNTEKSLKPTCPRCGDAASRLDLQRIPRRIIDRLIGMVHASHRYRCRAMGCDWAGNLSTSRGQR